MPRQKKQSAPPSDQPPVTLRAEVTVKADIALLTQLVHGVVITGWDFGLIHLDFFQFDYPLRQGHTDEEIRRKYAEITTMEAHIVSRLEIPVERLRDVQALIADALAKADQQR